MKKTAITLASGLAASLLLASCSTPPGLPKTLPDTRASLPDTWNAPEVKGGAFSARSDWWNEFSDPTLSSLIETGLSRSHNVRAALARLEEARAYAEETGAALYPNISLGADASNGRTESATSGAYQKSKIHRVQGEAAWEIDFWGKNRKAREAALASADSSLWAVRAVELSLAGNIARQYFGWVAARQSLAISENTLASLAKTLSITEAKYRLGTATEVDVNTARSDVETQRTAVSSWKLAAEQHLHALALLTAQPELKLPDSPYGLPEVPAIRPGDLSHRRPRAGQRARRNGLCLPQGFPDQAHGAPHRAERNRGADDRRARRGARAVRLSGRQGQDSRFLHRRGGQGGHHGRAARSAARLHDSQPLHAGGGHAAQQKRQNRPRRAAEPICRRKGRQKGGSTWITSLPSQSASARRASSLTRCSSRAA